MELEDINFKHYSSSITEKEPRAGREPGEVEVYTAEKRKEIQWKQDRICVQKRRRQVERSSLKE